jgi:acyl-CoA synthetase (AMP-forming)/AMP-acid ligase II/acyl carrier protein
VPQVSSAMMDTLSLLRQACARDPDRIAIEEPDVREPLTYAELLSAVETMARALEYVYWLGAPHGRRRVALVLPNGATMSISLLAVTSVGTAIPFSPRLTDTEYATYFRDCAVDAVLTCGSVCPGASSVARQLGLQVVEVDELLAARDRANELVPPDPRETALVLLTSGSTGLPKRVPLSHLNVCTSAREVAQSMALSASDRCLSMWELFHVGGLVDLLLAPLYAGGTVICTSGFDSLRCRRMILSERPTWFQGVPTTLRELLREVRQNGTPPRVHDSLRLLRSVAAPLPPPLMAELEATFGIPVLQTFGMTEAGPLITSTRLPPGPRKVGSVGQSCGCSIRVCSAEGASRPAGEEGEVWIQGPNVFSGYENDAKANELSFRNGWFRTGDLGFVDTDGFLFLTGRTKELVNRGGEKINLREVDDALATHAAIVEAASVAVPHPTLGEDIVACVVLKPGLTVGNDELQDHLRTRLAAFKIPSRVMRFESIPRTPVGKVDRSQLAEQITQLPSNEPKSPVGDALEECIAAIWRRELGTPAIGANEHFMSLGGDSLAALRIFLEVEKVIGPMTPEVLSKPLSTVQALAAFLRERGLVGVTPLPEVAAANFARRILLPVISSGPIPPVHEGSAFKRINVGGTKPPLIWFFNGVQKGMQALSERIPHGQPLYGGYSGAAHFRWDDDVSLNALAEHYTEELLGLFPTGEFRLGGNCQGGKLVWRITQRLIERGRTVRSLSLLEFSEPELGTFGGELLMMFGMHSLHRHYRPIRWGSLNWAAGFTRQPRVVWVPGLHGHFFSPANVGRLADVIFRFHEGQTLDAPGIDSLQGRAVWLIHRSERMLRVFAWIHQRFGGGA